MKIKERLNQIFKEFINIFSLEEVLKYIVICLVLVLFRIPLENLLNETIVKYAFKFISSDVVNDIIFIIFTILVSYITVKSIFRNYTPNINITIISWILLAGYSYYRITATVWTFTSFTLFPFLKYSDTLFIAVLARTINQFIKYKPKKSQNTNIEPSIEPFIEDSSLKSPINDKLGYKIYADYIAEKILASKFEKSFAIGINAKWGMGKTSFMYLIKQKIEKETNQKKETIDINFNPWNSFSPNAIIKDFFETMQEQVRPFHSSLSRLLIQYSSKLVAINSNTVTQSIQAIVALSTGFDSINKLYDEINEVLKKIDKQIVIYIDDLDRLDKQEVMEVIRLIRNTANFRNTVFVVTYDKNYIIESINEFNSFKPEEFLDKIFQLEITLPYFNKIELRRELYNQLVKIIPDKDVELYSTIVNGNNSTLPMFLDDWLEHFRDVTRLLNALSINLKYLVGEVVLEEYIKIELLRLKYPAVYELIFRRTEEFLDYQQGFEHQESHYILKIGSPDNDSSNRLFKINIFLIDNYSELSIPQSSIKKTVDLLDSIFNGGYNSSFHDISNLSIRYPSKFYRYFAYRLLEGNLSEIEFSNARASSQDVFNSKITEWVEKNMENELKNKFSQILSFDGKEDFEKIIKAIFHFASLPSDNDKIFSTGIVDYNKKDLNNKINLYKIFSKSNLNVFKNWQEDLGQFIKEVLNQARSPYIFESSFLNYIYNDLLIWLDDEFPLTKTEINNIRFRYFIDYCSEIQLSDKYIWRLFYNCTQEEYEHTENNTVHRKIAPTIPKQIKDKMKEFIINKDLKGILIDCIQTGRETPNTYSINTKDILSIFDSWADFELFLDRLDSNKYNFIEEFKEFYQLYKQSNYSYYITFEFKYLEIRY